MKILAVCTLAIICLVQFSQAGNIRNSDLAKRAELQRALLNAEPRKTVVSFIETKQKDFLKITLVKICKTILSTIIRKVNL